MKQIVYTISDSSGETATNFARSMMAQFNEIDTTQKRYSFIKDIDQLTRILQHAQQDQALVFYTLSNPEFDQIVKNFDHDKHMLCFDILSPYLTMIEAFTGQKASHEIGAARKLSTQYFKRIEAIDFAAENDDGKNPHSMVEADVVLLGISRTSKTPLTFYLANQEIKVMNLPLVPSVQLPDELWEIDPQKIVGLTNDEEVLRKIREERMLSYGLKAQTNYSSTEKIQQELQYAQNLYDQLGCLVINVANKSIEEVAAIIEEKLQLNTFSAN
ncbi:kinase/pyrophosphorylase [Bombilactobacillus folatiphilus]|uniref:Putative pyruvate, phosphate dikinase regulatory protein n=1 Tax=Bombilactobacillus folatiphilus TaxID=2923362 RepID=A0ABY4P7N4_9LACO|nr:pyruvate, water dikinase regulatory protein [Bombilactobacillus folatiphilus]UQS81534.1 kinase/pyrophosphorylase [Bombilactobacillus folatiphilus]